jgi:nucleoside-diphosphate kinase
MSIEQTLSIIKPDATSRNITGQVNSIIEKSGLKIIGQKRIKLTKETAGKFYEVHKERPFFQDLVSFMVSGPVIVQVLQGENAVALYRKVMGATNPQEAEAGSIRKEFALSIEANSVHGSDSIENAKKEISFFFSETEIFED